MEIQDFPWCCGIILMSKLTTYLDRESLMEDFGVYDDDEGDFCIDPEDLIQPIGHYEEENLKRIRKTIKEIKSNLSFYSSPYEEHFSKMLMLTLTEFQVETYPDFVDEIKDIGFKCYREFTNTTGERIYLFELLVTRD